MSQYVCDICSRTFDRSEILFYSAEKMKLMVRNGLNPWETPGFNMSSNVELARLFGLGSNAIYSHWRQRVMMDSTDWGVCPTCDAAISKFLGFQPRVSVPDWKAEADRLVASGILSKFVTEQHGAWDHQGWLTFLAGVRSTGYTRIPGDEVGRLLEQEKARFWKNKA